MEYGILQDDDEQQEFIYSKKLRKKVPIEKTNEEVSVSDATAATAAIVVTAAEPSVTLEVVTTATTEIETANVVEVTPVIRRPIPLTPVTSVNGLNGTTWYFPPSPSPHRCVLMRFFCRLLRKRLNVEYSLTTLDIFSFFDQWLLYSKKYPENSKKQVSLILSFLVSLDKYQITFREISKPNFLNCLLKKCHNQERALSYI